MATAIRLEKTGGPEVLEIKKVKPAQPGKGEVWVEQEAIGVNYLDVMQRNGTVPISLPNGLGLEAAGRVAAVGSDVSSVTVGDRVGYILGPIGAYASGRIYPAEHFSCFPTRWTSKMLRQSCSRALLVNICLRALTRSVAARWSSFTVPQALSGKS